MKSCIINLLVLYTFVNTDDITRKTTRRYGLFVKLYEDKYLSHAALIQHEVTNVRYCAQFCLRNNQCKSFNINIANKPMLCNLLVKDASDSPTYISAVGFRHYDAFRKEDILLSQGKPAAESSTANQHPSYAVDGNTNQMWKVSGGGCTHTNIGTGNWIRIDLQQRALVNSVTIYNRVDCCSERLSDAEIHVADSADNIVNRKLCVEFSRITTSNQIETFQCNDFIYGRYVRLTINSYNILTVCEMKIWGYFI